MKSYIFGFLLPILTFSQHVGSAEQAPYTLLIYGDSLSAAYGISEQEGWVALLAEKISSEGWPYRVVNSSVSGETTTGGVERLPSILSNYQPNLVILELGGNDGLRGLPVNLMKTNLKNMVSSIRSAGGEVLLTGIQIPPNYGPRYTEPFYATFSEISEEESILLVPFLLEGIPQNPELMQDDGIHPTAEAQQLILDNVWPILEPLLEKK
tara:strand:- start:169 stop:798 length:630 start_codon:yes stop_codon:yes gene_type:complete